MQGGRGRWGGGVLTAAKSATGLLVLDDDEDHSALGGIVGPDQCSGGLKEAMDHALVVHGTPVWGWVGRGGSGGDAGLGEAWIGHHIFAILGTQVPEHAPRHSATRVLFVEGKKWKGKKGPGRGL